MMTSNASVLNLIRTIRAHWQRRAEVADAVGREAATVLKLLENVPLVGASFTRSNHAATRHLNTALQEANSSTADLLAALRPVAFDLPWQYSYNKRKDSPSLENEIAFAEIIGPGAPFESVRVCIGITLIGPETLYPEHSHPATELYLAATGEATWIANGVSTRNSSGVFILHPSHVVHAMQSYRTPLLAIYSWSGDDVKSPSVYN